jgi:hypothetical protein
MWAARACPLLSGRGAEARKEEGDARDRLELGFMSTFSGGDKKSSARGLRVGNLTCAGARGSKLPDGTVGGDVGGVLTSIVGIEGVGGFLVAVDLVLMAIAPSILEPLASWGCREERRSPDMTTRPRDRVYTSIW